LIESGEMSEPNPFAPFFDELRKIVKEEIAAAVKGSRDDKLVTVEECCKVLSCDPTWLYRNAKRLPFTRKVGGLLRFSSNGLQHWISAQRLKAKNGG
jgi:predicted DNA-binding transcriptional regulator AlpA